MGSTGPSLLTRTPPSRRLHHSSHSRDKLLDSICSANPANLQGKQQQVYTIVQQHQSANSPPPLRMIVSGTAGTGKSYLIHCLRLLLQRQLLVAAPTGVAAFNIDGQTLHSLPTRAEFKDLEGERLTKLQQAFSEVKYLIIDEMSMVGRKIFGQVHRRLRQAFPHHSQEVFGGCSCLLFGDFGQLPPVMDLPLYTTDSRSELSDQGRAAYQTFQLAVVLDQVMRQAGQDPEQVKFRDILLRLRDAKATLSDWNYLMSRTPTRVQDLSPFSSALHLIPTVEAVVEYNVAQLQASGQPIATIKAVHNGANAAKAPADDAGGLEAVVCLAHSARVMLNSNLWVDVGLVNGAIQAICYRTGGPLTFPSLSWSALTAILAPPSLTAPYPSLLFAAAGPPQEEASAHDSSCPSSWRGQSPSTSPRVSPWTRRSLMLARESYPHASHSSPALVSVSCKTCCSPLHSPSSASPASLTSLQPPAP